MYITIQSDKLNYYQLRLIHDSLQPFHRHCELCSRFRMKMPASIDKYTATEIRLHIQSSHGSFAQSNSSGSFAQSNTSAIFSKHVNCGYSVSMFQFSVEKFALSTPCIFLLQIFSYYVLMKCFV